VQPTQPLQQPPRRPPAAADHHGMMDDLVKILKAKG
jgi:hypothetical protein